MEIIKKQVRPCEKEDKNSFLSIQSFSGHQNYTINH